MEWVYSVVALGFSAVFFFEYYQARREGRNLIMEMLQAMTKGARDVGEHIVGREKDLRACSIGVGFFTLGLCAPLLSAIGNLLVKPYGFSEWPWRAGYVFCSAMLLLIGIPAGVRFNRWVLGER